MLKWYEQWIWWADDDDRSIKFNFWSFYYLFIHVDGVAYGQTYGSNNNDNNNYGRWRFSCKVKV